MHSDLNLICFISMRELYQQVRDAVSMESILSPDAQNQKILDVNIPPKSLPIPQLLDLDD